MSSWTPIRAAGCLLAFFIAHPAVAGAQSAAAPKVLAAGTRTEPIRVDGQLDEPDWAQAEVATDFVQREPRPGAPASQRTEVRVLVDAAAVYIGARMFETDPRSIAAQLTRRDGDAYSDVFHVVIDSYFDRRTGFRFSVSAAGVQNDGLFYNDTNEDGNWDAVFETATSIDSLGWVAEMRIPLSQLRFGRLAPGQSRRWGINFGRTIARLDELSLWNPVLPTDGGVVSRFGDLVGLDALGTPTRLEILPYVSSQLTRLPGAETNPLVSATELSGRVGVDVRYGLPRGLTLTATVNPDFGQVEVDPAVVNLTAFETFFAERRPFFLEGNEIFRFGGTVTHNDNDPPRPFYSRRIGRSPRGSVDAADAAYVDRPTQTDILGAVKVSGKTPGGWSLGVLGAVTEEVRARYQTATGAERTTPVEPRAGYGVARLSRDFRAGHSSVGLAFTGAGRDMSPAFSSLLASSALSVGLNAEHAWDNRRWVASGYVSRSHVEGDPSYLATLQHSNTHVFHRPDREITRYDPARESLGGHFYALSLAKTAGRHWLGSFTYEETGPGYDVNELGFQRRSDLRSLNGAITYREASPTRLFRNYVSFVHVTSEHNFDGDLIDRRYAWVTDVQWHNFWSTDIIARWNPQTYDDRLTRGGPLALRIATRGISLSISTDDRKPAAVELGYEFESSASGEWRHTWELDLELRPSSALRFSVAPEFIRQYDYDQYVTAVSDGLATHTFGRRYVFGDLEQRELSVATRAEWTFSPTLSLQLFAQPLISAGRFDRYKEFRTPRTFDFDVYGRDRGTIVRDRRAEQVLVDPDAAGPAPAFRFGERDFTVRALRGSAVLRWEYRPGSAIFLVWQQVGESEEAVAELGAAQRPGKAFGIASRNVFLIKASYWLSR